MHAACERRLALTPKPCTFYRNRFRPGKGHSQRNVEDSVSLVKLQAGKIAAAEKARLAKLSAKEQRDLLNAETARLKLEEVVERKRAMLEERFERLNHARENEERRQAEKRAEWMEKERKREEATREAKRAAAENWQKRKVEHQTQIEAHKQAWYNKLTTTEKEVQSRMSEKFSREQERLKAQEAAREAELRERRKALEQHHTQKRMAYEQRCAQEQQRRNELDAAWARKLQELEDLDNEVKRMLNERSMANAEYWEYCQNLVAQARKHDKLFRESLSGILDGRGERAHEMQKRRAMLQNRIQLLNHNLAVSKEDLANMVEVAWSPMPDVKVEPPPPLPEFKVKKRGPTAAEAAAAEMAAQEQKRREAELDKLADSGQYPGAAL